MDPEKKNKKCELCDGEDKNKSIQGLVIIKGLTKEDDEYSDENVDELKDSPLKKKNKKTGEGKLKAGQSLRLQ